MTQKRLITSVSLAILPLLLVSCRQQARYAASTPREALETVRAAVKNIDVELFKRTLSAKTIDWLTSEARRTNESVDQILKIYLERQESEGAMPSTVEKEERLDENTVELRTTNERILGRFVREGSEWKLDGFGWRIDKER